MKISPEYHPHSATWRKSAYSDGGGNCLEVADGLPVIPVRDSKAFLGPALVFRAAARTSFVEDLKGRR